MKSAAKATVLQAVVALLVVGALIYVARSAPFLGAVEETENVVRRWGTLSIMIYPLLVMAATVLLLPGGILSLGADFSSDCGGERCWCWSVTCSGRP